MHTRQQRRALYAKYVLVATAVTCGLFTLQVKYILCVPFQTLSFALPISVGAVFGYLLATVKLLSEQYRFLATTDHLTKLTNRAQFDKWLTNETLRSQRTGSSLCLAMIDLDHFKKVNDEYGHKTGDKVLKQLASVLRESTRRTDLAARWGGEEFIVMMPDTDLTGAGVQAERVREAVSQVALDGGIKLTCSIGLAQYQPEDDTVDTLLDRADRALYHAKSSGRNRVEAMRV